MILSNEERIYTLEAVVALTLIPRNNNNTTESNPINLSSNNSQANGNQIAPNLSQANSSSTSPSLESIQAQLNNIISSLQTLQTLQTRVSSLENDVNEIKSKIQGKQ